MVRNTRWHRSNGASLLVVLLGACAGHVGSTHTPNDEPAQDGDRLPDAGAIDEREAPSLSAGCGLNPQFVGGPTPLSIDVPATEAPQETQRIKRQYHLYVPAPYDALRPYQLLFSFHSCGGTGERGFPEEVAQLSGESTIIVSPTGLSPSTRCNGNGWSSPSDLPFFDALYDSITQAYCVDLDRVFSTGHSYGGEMTNMLNCKRGDVLRGTASRSGGLAGDNNCQKGLPATFLAHVEGDTSPAPFSASETLVKVRIADRGCDGENTFFLDEAGCRVYAGCSSRVTYCRCTAPIEDCGLSSGMILDPHGITDARAWRNAAWTFLRSLP